MTSRDQPATDAIEVLLNRIQAGDRQAEEELLNGQRDALRRFIAVRMNAGLAARLDASDVVQDTFMEVHRRLPEFMVRKPMPFAIWLRKTALERIIMERRRHLETAGRAVDREISLPDDSADVLAQRLIDSGASPSQQASKIEQARQVRAALAELDEGDRNVLLLRLFEGFSYAEVGWILEISEEAARQRQGRALVRLHRLLTARGWTGELG